MPITIPKVGDVIVLNHQEMRKSANYFRNFDFLFKHQPWIIAQVMSDTTIRVKSFDGKVAMSTWICLEQRLGEYTFDRFLTAVHKASRKKK